MKKYNEWNEVKKNISIRDTNLIFKVRDVFWLQVGQNIGFETDGKGDRFIRPVLVLRKFSKDTFLGIPLTTSKKNDIFHYEFSLSSNGKVNYANLSQIKLFDAKRIHDKLGRVSVKDFENMKIKLQKLIFE